ncbi:MAG: ankyrin repeat domain-containing protein [Burkholderiaceae bacterium]|nr:ankyrin repeat domain-containing protein [Burkholderiaceae bacterium]
MATLMQAGHAEARCMRPGSALARLEPRSLIAEVDSGQAGREAMAAVLAGNTVRVTEVLRVDPRLISAGTADLDLLAVAAVQCDIAMVDLLLNLGARPDGTKRMMPLIYGINAVDPAVAQRLLRSGASVKVDRARDQDPLDEAIMLRAPGAVRLLLDHGADPNQADELGQTPLSSAIDVNAMDIAELLIERGANIWQISASGATIGYNLARPPVNAEPAQDAIRARLVARLRVAGFPWPPPDWREGRKLLIAGNWPPPRARNAPHIHESIIAVARENEARAARRGKDTGAVRSIDRHRAENR